MLWTQDTIFTTFEVVRALGKLQSGAKTLDKSPTLFSGWLTVTVLES